MADRTPTCCKRPMSRKNGQFVCGRCRGWLDLGLIARGARTGDR